MSVLTICFHFNEIYDCVKKASSTAANQNCVTANTHQLSSLFDPALIAHMASLNMSYISLCALIPQIQSGNGDVTITNDGATILKQMQVFHPAAKMVSLIPDLPTLMVCP